MLPIQLLFTVVFLVLLAYAARQKRVSAILSRIVMLGVLMGLVLLWWPDLTNQIANILGVGRGADLLLYSFIFLGLVVSFNLHLRQHQQDAAITKLVRELALLKATPPKESAHDSRS